MHPDFYGTQYPFYKGNPDGFGLVVVSLICLVMTLLHNTL